MCFPLPKTGWSVRGVFVVAQHDERPQARLDAAEDVDRQVDVRRGLAQVAGDAQKVGRQTVQSRTLDAVQAWVFAPHVQVADVQDG